MTEQIKYIPARLKSAVKGGHVTGAEDIDAGDGKNQQQVNNEVEDTLAFHQSEISGLNSQNYVTVATYASLPATGEADTIYRVSSYDGTQVDATKYAEYAWNGSAYVLLDVKTQVGEVFDISEYKAVGGTLTKFADLAAALDGGDNVPVGVRKGGMSVKFVQSSDNKYVQYRLIADEWSTNTNDWTFCGDDVLVENPEWIYVLLDAEKRILAGLKPDGSVEWSIGVPTPVKTYIDNAIAEIKNGTEGIDIDGLNKIIAFLSDFSTSDTLKDLLDSKVDKEEGKSLIDAEYASSQSAVENPEWLSVTTDSEEKILGGRKQNGTVVENCGAEIKGNIVTDGYENSIVESNEWVKVTVDADRKILEGIRKDGNIYFGNDNILLSGIKKEIADIKYNMNIYSETKEPNYVSFNTNTITILSSTDEDATQYDNARVFLPCILQISDSMYYMYYGGLGKTDPNTDVAIHALFAYSIDGIHWTRGFPNGVEPPYPNEHNVFTKNVMDSYNVFRVPDSEYPFRMIGNRYTEGHGIDMCYYKSTDGVHWNDNEPRVIIPWGVLKDEWGYDVKYSDTFPTCIVRGNYIKIYMRLWKTYRYIGTMVIDLNGNIVKKPTIEIDIPKLYLAAGSAIDDRREMLLPTEYIGGVSDAFQYRCILVDGDKYKELNTNINELIPSGIGWGYFGVNMVMIDNKQYVSLSDQNISHEDPAPITDYVANIKLVEVNFKYKNYKL